MVLLAVTALSGPPSTSGDARAAGKVAALTSPSPTPSSVTKPALASASSTSGSPVARRPWARRRASAVERLRAQRARFRRAVLPIAVRKASAFVPSPPRFQGASSQKIPGTAPVGLAQQLGLRLHRLLVDATLGDDRDGQRR